MIKDILTLIEKVDPADSAGLDEIDEAVEGVITGWAIIRHTPQYTRSRDALKYIRPKEWLFDISAGRARYKCFATPPNGDDAEITASAPTEELAELYVILSAIEHERGLK